MTPQQSDQLEAELEQIMDEYGYFLGLAYEDKNGQLAIHKKGEVVKRLNHFIQTNYIRREQK